MVDAVRTPAQRKRDVLAKLAEVEADVWVATATASAVAHLVPLSYAWDGRDVVLAAERASLTVRNATASGRARLGFGPTRDVVIVDAALELVVEVNDAPAELADRYARQSGWDPRRERAAYDFLILRPQRIQAWREANELADKLLMRDGEWLA